MLREPVYLLREADGREQDEHAKLRFATAVAIFHSDGTISLSARVLHHADAGSIRRSPAADPPGRPATLAEACARAEARWLADLLGDATAALLLGISDFTLDRWLSICDSTSPGDGRRNGSTGSA